MTSPTAPSPAPKSQTFGSWLRTMPRWKKIAVAAAVLTVVAGGVMSMSGDGAATGGGAGSGGNLSGLNASLTEGRPTLGGGGGEEPAAKGVFRLGFSFLAGFCIGSFIRATLKVAAIAFGFWLFLTMVLSYYGIMTVDWTQMDSLWSRFAGNVEREWGSFQTFMTGSLPAAGLAITGLAIGLKRH